MELLSYLCSLCSSSWQSLQVKVSQVSQKSFSGSCLWMGQKTGLCPGVATDSKDIKDRRQTTAKRHFRFAKQDRRKPQKALVRASGCMVSPARVTVQATRLCSTVTMATAYQRNHIHCASTGVSLIWAFAVLASIKHGSALCGEDRPSYRRRRQHPPSCGSCGPWLF